MIKVVVLLPRRDDMSREKVERYQREWHLALVANRLRRVVRHTRNT